MTADQRKNAGPNAIGLRPNEKGEVGLQLRSTLILSLIAFAYFSALAFVAPTNPYDEGIVLYGGARVAAGDIPYRDFFTLYGPAQFWAIGAAFRVFGTAVLGARLYVAVILAAVTGCAYFLAARLTSCRWAVLSWLVTLGALVQLPFGYPAAAALLCALLGGIALGRFFERPRRGLLLWAGAGIGAAGLFRHDFGVYALLASSLTLIAFSMTSERRCLTALVRWGWMFAGVMLVAAPACIFLLAVVPFDLLYHDLWWFPTKVYPSVRSLPWLASWPDISLLAEGRYPPARYLMRWSVLVDQHFPLLILVAALWLLVAKLWRRQGFAAADWSALHLCLLGLGLFNHGRIRVTLIQLAPATIVASVFLAQLAFRSWISARRSCQLLTSMALVLFLAGPVGRLCIRPWAVVHADRSTTAEQAQAVEFVRQHTEVGERIFVGNTRHDCVQGNDVMFYFLAQRHSATRYHELHPGQVTTLAVQTDIIGDLKRHHVRAVVLYDEEPSTEPNESAVSSGVKVLDDYLRQHYQCAASFGRYKILLAS